MYHYEPGDKVILVGTRTIYSYGKWDKIRFLPFKIYTICEVRQDWTRPKPNVTGLWIEGDREFRLPKDDRFFYMNWSDPKLWRKATILDNFRIRLVNEILYPY